MRLGMLLVICPVVRDASVDSEALIVDLSARGD